MSTSAIISISMGSNSLQEKFEELFNAERIASGESAISWCSSLFRSIFMGNVEIPTQGGPIYKCPVSAYEFGANIMSNKVSWVQSEIKMTLRVSMTPICRFYAQRAAAEICLIFANKL